MTKTLSNIKRKAVWLVSLTVLLACLCCGCKQQREPTSQLEEGFMHPPDSVKPSVYWYWLSDNVSADGVAKDIAAMDSVGIGRAFIGNIGLSKEEVPYGSTKLFSDAWWRATASALKAASAHGIDIGFFNSPGWSQSGGPWIKDDQAMRYLGSSTMHVTGPHHLVQQLPTPAPSFQDVKLLAIPAPNTPIAKPDIVTAQPAVKGVAKIMDQNFETVVALPAVANTVLLVSYAKPVAVRSITFYPVSSAFSAEVEVWANAKDGFMSIKKFTIDRSNVNLNVGFRPFAPVAINLPTTTASEFKIALSNVSGLATFSEISFSELPVVERYMEKQLAKMYPTPLPLWNEYQWPMQHEVEDGLYLDPQKVLDVSSNVSAEGLLTWDVPAGDWLIIRYGMVPTGVTNSPASIEGRGPEVDKMNKEALAHHFRSFIEKIEARIPEADRKTWKWVVADSYETGSQNWTDNFLKDFEEVYGYNATPWLPVLNGQVVGSMDQSDRFLWDLRRLIADRVSYSYVGGLRELAHAHGLKVWLENYGHWGFPGEFLQYGGQSDEIAGEFWNEGTLGNIECRAASSAAHIYGKQKVSAESFTAGGLAFLRHPAMLKKRGDWSFTEGINNTLLHVYITQPYDSLPGVNAGFGTEFNRNNTWFYQGKAFIDYLRRCNFMLQQGKVVNDVAYFIGEDTPKMTGVRDPELPAGYSYDYINAEVIINRMSVRDGRLILPDGMSYRVLVLPSLTTMRPELLRKIRDLVQAGATVLGSAPDRSPSLQNYPKADEEVKKIAHQLWGDSTNTSGFITHGKGRIYAGATLQVVMHDQHTLPDFLSSEPNVLYTHRSTPQEEIYFVTNQQDEEVATTLTFRTAHKQPEWWDASTGSMRPLNDFTINDGNTAVPVTLAAHGSAFIVFRKEMKALTGKGSNFPTPTTLSTVDSRWVVTFDSTKRGPSKSIVFEHLIDWSTHTDERIKYYSGTAHYATDLTLESIPKGQTIFIYLGKVEAMAEVKLNGISLGTAWTAPYRVDITKAIKQGKNKLEISVVNTWVNRLIGDSKLTPAERKTWSNVNPYTPTSTLDPSGLIGPVTIQAIKY